MAVTIHFEDIPTKGLKKKPFIKIPAIVCLGEKKKSGNISIILCSDDYLLELNTKYLEHDYYTDIITFDYCEGDKMNGDLFISYHRVMENSNYFNTSFESELSRVIIHGILHLAGYKDNTKPQQELMKQKENEYLSKINLICL